MSKSLKIIQIAPSNSGGGSELFAYNLMKVLYDSGHDTKLYVGRKIQTTDTKIKALSRKEEVISSVINQIIGTPRLKIIYRIALTYLSSPQRIINYFSGKEKKVVYNTERNLKRILKTTPDIIHCHTLQSKYFDLSSLVYLSNTVPTVITLHDAGLLTGHCSHYFYCEKWKVGCDECPDLSIYPALRRDVTKYNWNKRAEIYKKSKLYIVSPCSWLLDKAHESILAPSIQKSMVIPNGINLALFQPGNKMEARRILSLPYNKYILVFSAGGLKKNMFKDYQCLKKTLEIIGNSNHEVLCLAIGDTGNTEYIGKSVEIKFIPYITDRQIIVKYYQAADVYVHPAKADTFPTSVIEAEACGLPVVASAVCGIPEQIIDGETGYLVPSGDAEMMAERILQLKDDVVLREMMGKNAVRLAMERYDEKIMVERYLEFYQSVLNT